MESAEMAALIVDALYTAGLISENKLEAAIAIAAEELEVRKALESGRRGEKLGLEDTYP